MPSGRILSIYAATVISSAGFAGLAHAGTCLVKVVDDAAVQVRVCDPDENDACGSVLFEGPLASGEERALTPSGDRVVYEVFNDERQTYDPVTTAICQGGVVEL